MLKPFLVTNKTHWVDAMSLLLYTLVGALLPVWFGPLFLRIISVKIPLTNFIDHGEFALYSAALLSPAFYLVAVDRNPPGFPYRRSFILVLVVLILASTGIFAGVIVGTTLQNQPFILDKSFLRYITIFIFIISIFSSLAISVLDNARLEPNLQAMKAKEMKKLEDEFDKTERGGK